ncbi:MAG TPA: 3-dehydro-L-gulonate 2-dehydrogenase [Terracidiphilus sp.]|nr:3-dehydro-L-gulonate 2-dehydrogenase [Terracidiphilus sp.]
MNRIPLEEVQGVLERVLRGFGMTEARARLCARLFAETTCDGVYTHGVSRFPRFVATIRNGCVDVSAEPLRVAGLGAVERWDGQKGPGNLNAYACMERAMSLSRAHGVACVSLGNTNHWMRGGTYGWQAAEAGLIAICWTNTMPNLPPWGGAEPCIGNNPMVIAVPRANGPVVLDMAMSQFSYGALESYRKRGEMLPVEGGFDDGGAMTRDPGAIERSQRALPIGYWKGGGLSIVLDMMAAVLSLGRATHQIPRDSLREAGVSQVFIAMDPAGFGAQGEASEIVDDIVASLHDCRPAHAQETVRYPGERTLRTRAENRRLGLPVDAALWDEILALQGGTQHAEERT